MQHRCATLARMGAYVVSLDMVGFGESCPDFGKAPKDLMHYHQSLDNMIAKQIWRLLRCVDLLISTRWTDVHSWAGYTDDHFIHVDPERIGCTGCSGGGT